MKAKKRDVLVVIAHPDDEIFASGTICLCAEKGFRINVICATDGEGGSRLHNISAHELAELRRRELICSARALGASEVLFLGQADIAGSDGEGQGSWDQSKLIATLASIIRQNDPRLILTHGPLGGYGHPAHRLVHSSVMAAARAASYSGSIFSFAGRVRRAFFSWHFDQPSDILIDARGFLERRVASLSCHQSQLSYFLQPYFPRTVRKFSSALFGLVFAFTEAGRKRVPIATPKRFFDKLPIEGLVLQKSTDAARPNFFQEHCLNDNRVQIVRQGIATPIAAEDSDILRA
ncbi:MAG: PIG-L deacetylase family protein [Rhizomicrobium sp.]